MTQIRIVFDYIKHIIWTVTKPVSDFLHTPKALRLIQKIIDTTIPAGCWLSQIALALTLVQPPESIVLVFADPTVAYFWSLISFLAYSSIIVGVWINPTPRLLHVLGDELFLYFEYPGLITASMFTMVYGIALIARFGILSTSTVAAGFSFAIGIYFFCRYLRTWLMLRTARKIAIK